MRTYCLVVHNSDEVKAVFVGDTIKSIIKRVMGSKHGQDIINRSLVYYNDYMSDDHMKEDYIDVDEIPFNDLEDDFIEELITRLYHDGDSEDGYTLFDTDLSNNTVLYFKDN